MIEIIGGVWAAGETKTFHVNGEYLEILDCQYTCDVMLMDKVGAQLSIMKGCEASFFSRPKEGYNTVQITSPQAQYLRVFLGSGDAGTRRISSTVQVVDGARQRTLAGGAYIAAVDCAATPGFISASAIFNPAASGRRMVVSKIILSTDSVATAIGFGSRGNSLGTLNPGVKPYSKLCGAGFGTTTAVLSLDQTLVAMPGGQPQWGVIALPASSTFVLDMPEPVVMPPNTGFCFWTGQPNAGLHALMHYTDEAI